MTRMLAILILSGAALLAQPSRGMFAWWDSPLAKDLNLSDAQTTQIRATVKEYRVKLIDLRANLEKAEGEVEDAFNEPSLDQRKANEAIEKLASSRADFTRAISQMSLRLRTVLTPEQWAELQKRRPRLMPGGEPRFRQRKSGEGPGLGPGGPPAPFD